MFRIDPDTLYSEADLADELGGLMKARTFIRGLKGRLRCQFKGVYFGQDLLDALRAPKPEKASPTLPSLTPKPRSKSDKARGNPHYID